MPPLVRSGSSTNGKPGSLLLNYGVLTTGLLQKRSECDVLPNNCRKIPTSPTIRKMEKEGSKKGL